MTTDEMIEKQVLITIKTVETYTKVLTVVQTEDPYAKPRYERTEAIKDSTLQGLAREVEFLRFLREGQMKVSQGG